MKRFMLIILASLIAFPAMAQVPKPNPLAGIAKRNDMNAPPIASSDTVQMGEMKLGDELLAKILPDLKYASALAKQNNNKVTSPCLDALLGLIESWHAPVKDDAGNVIPLPEPHLITAMERQSELLRQLQPDSTLSIGCSAMAQAFKKDIMALVGGILTGGALGIMKLPIIP